MAPARRMGVAFLGGVVVAATLLVGAGDGSARVRARRLEALVEVHGPWPANALTVGDERAVIVDVLAATPVRSITLFDGSTSVGTVDVRGRRIARTFTWVPATAGERPLVAVVTDADHRVARSIPRWVSVAPTAAATTAATTAATNAATTAATTAPGPPRAVNVAATGAPSVTVDPSSCTAAVTPTGSARSKLYAATAGSGGFVPLGSADPGEVVVVPVGAGAVAVLAAPPGGGAGAPPVVVEVPAECATQHWTGDAWVADGIVHTPVAASAAYLYLSVGGGPWTRVPAADQTFVPGGPDPTTFDFRGKLPAFTETVEMEVWGRGAGGAQLLGRGKFAVALTGTDTAKTAAGALVVSPFPHADLDLIRFGATKTSPEVLARSGTLAPYSWKKTVVKSQEGSEGGGILLQVDDGKRAFRWQANHPGVDGAIWQVSSLAPPDTPDLTFPGLRHYQPMSGDGGTFTIDFKKLLVGKSVTQAKAPGSLDYEQVVLPGGSAGGEATTKKTLGKPVQTGAAPNTDKPATLWVRVVPTKDGQPVDAASNVVVFSVEWFNIAKFAKAFVSTFNDVFVATSTITAPSLPNAAYGRCVRVVDNPFLGNPTALGGSNPSPYGMVNQAKYKPAPIGSTHCPAYTPPDQDWWDYFVSFVEGVADFYNALATFVNDLKNQVVSKFAMYSGCSSALGASFCKSVITTAIDVYLTANGIPPTVPTTPDLKADLEDQLAQLAAQQVAGVCPVGSEAICEEQVKKAAKELIAKVEDQVSDAAFDAAQTGDYTLYLNPAIQVVPEPAGQLNPSVVTIQVTKQAPPYKTKVPDSCTFTAYSTAVQPNYQWHGRTSIKGPIVSQTGAVSGSPFASMSKTISVAEMQPGDTATVVLSVGPLNEFWAPGKSPLYGWWGQKPDTGAFFLDGGEISVGWKGCGIGDLKTFPQSGDVGDTLPGEISYP